MGRVFLDMAVSVDGFAVGREGADGGLHDWYFAEGAATPIKDELLRDIGAIILGHRAFGDSPDGFETPYHVPHFVLAHSERATVRNGGATFSFVTQGIEAALAQAQAAAGERWVCVAGGIDTAHQFLAAGLLDEMQLHLAPVLLGGGRRLFDEPTPTLGLERLRVVESKHATHVRFRISK